MPQYHGIMFRMGRGDSPWHAPMAELWTTDVTKFLAWAERLEGQGYVEAAEHEQHIAMLRSMSKRRQAELSKPYNPTPQDVANDRANKPSGKGQKPLPKPVRDYRGTKEAAGPWMPLPGGR